MQKLVFHNAWDKTLSSKDRKRIEKEFEKTKNRHQDLEIIILWLAMNHKGECLVTTLIHNRGNQSFPTDEIELRLVDHQKVIAEHTFTIPFTLEPFTSMPWTFIFSENSLGENSLENALIEWKT
ncbi:SLAP domain-containing protein [Salinibacillus xinjiangensis]|uniref:SLAP domain-containing protein n=1 Tax=Salinibacillus xinjiangensis TaxID=1229268 RepID=A0A6G1X8X9_9BACI|nr:SLAP domain-containing protein [Salinibacillus xinjiangensis]MRG87461.1 SLAP domain-containing protein [Salinibacillus xinjiangensis]